MTPGLYARFATTEGTFTVRLFEKETPKTVANFVALAQGTKEWTDPSTRAKSTRPFYDGLVFHRVVKDPQPFVIQTGDPRGNGSGGPGYIFNDEISPNLKHELGALAMANAGPNTNGSQFYITLSAVTALDGKYNVFGKVTSGQDVADKIAVGDKIVSITIAEK